MNPEKKELQTINFFEKEIIPAVYEFAHQDANPKRLGTISHLMSKGISLPFAISDAVMQDARELAITLTPRNPKLVSGIDLEGNLNYTVRYLMLADQYSKGGNIMDDLKAAASKIESDEQAVEESIKILERKARLYETLYHQDRRGFKLLNYILMNPDEIKSRQEREGKNFPVADKLRRFGVIDYRKYYVATEGAKLLWQKK